MASTPKRARKASHLRLVSCTEPAALPPIMSDPAARQEFEKLTQMLVEIAIEITDLVQGDRDVEANGDELEDDDGF